jgi:nucleoside-diphosphate-sugar epimerase
VYIKDAVRANVLAIRSGSGVFNIASVRRTSLSELAALIGKILDRDVQPEQEDPRPGDNRDSYADISRARDIGYKPETSLEDGLVETIWWFSNRANR